MLAERVELMVSREGNAILGNFYRVIAYKGAYRLGERVYAGYSRRESVRLARELIRERGRLD
jgi:hypothetical protein